MKKFRDCKERLECLQENHPRRYKGACRLVKQMEANGFKRSGVNSWSKGSRRHLKTITLYIDCFEVYDQELPAKEGWSRYFKKYTNELFKAKNAGMLYVCCQSH